MHTTTNRKQPGTTEARASSRVATAIAILLLLSSVARGQILLELDLSEPDQAKRWRPTHDVGELERRFDGLHVPVTGPDPYLRGPVVDLPGGIPLWLHLEVEPDRSGSVQIFWWGVGQHPTEERSVRVPVRRGEVNRRRVSIPALGEGTALRFDPPSTAKACRLKRIAFERRLVHPEPEWEVPALRPARSGDQAVVSGAIAGSLDRAGLSLEVEEQLIAVLAGPLPIVWMDDDETLHEVDTKAGRTIVRNRADANVVDQDWRDDRGTAWHLRRILTAGPIAGSLALSWELTANQDRELLFFCPLLLNLGGDRPSTEKGGALLPGVEYLEDEPSSSEADVIGRAAQRRIPHDHEVTDTWMAWQGHGRFLALAWDRDPMRLAPFFDLPDRSFGTGGQVFGLLSPGSTPSLRERSALLPHDSLHLQSGRPLKGSLLLIGGAAQDLTDAVRTVHAHRGLPTLPPLAADLHAYTERARAGWSRILRQGGLARHAVWPGFQAMPSRDAWVYGPVLGLPVPLEKPPPLIDPFAPTVSHIRRPIALHDADVDLELLCRDAAQRASSRLALFRADGCLPWLPSAGGNDLGATHFRDHANGRSAAELALALEEALFAGDASAIAQGLKLLEALREQRGRPPRGAQTWEIPLHTPDLLAAAWLVKASVLGFEASGDPRFLDDARHWAWAGLPFVYLDPRLDDPALVGATIAVLGATHRSHPLWFGRPVPWCGLVFADSLRRLARHDEYSGSPWAQVAELIVRAALRQTFEHEDTERGGLLPHFWEIDPGIPAGPAINPGALQGLLLEGFGMAPISDSRRTRVGIHIHAPGGITELEDDGDQFAFRLHARPGLKGQILINGLKIAPAITIDGRSPVASAWHPETGRASVVIAVPASGALRVRVVVKAP